MGGVPSHVLRGLWQGGTDLLDNEQFIQENKITHILSVCHRTTKLQLPELSIKHLNIKDDLVTNFKPHFPDIVNWIHLARTNGGVVYIHCSAGISRSSTCTLAYMMCFLNMDPEELLEHLRIVRRHACPNPNFLNQLKEFFNDPNGKDAIRAHWATLAQKGETAFEPTGTGLFRRLSEKNLVGMDELKDEEEEEKAEAGTDSDDSSDYSRTPNKNKLHFSINPTLWQPEDPADSEGENESEMKILKLAQGVQDTSTFTRDVLSRGYPKQYVSPDDLFAFDKRTLAWRKSNLPHPSAGKMLTLHFRLPYRAKYGEVVVVVGNIETLGNWYPPLGIMLEYNKQDGTWVGQVHIPVQDLPVIDLANNRLIIPPPMSKTIDSFFPPDQLQYLPAHSQLKDALPSPHTDHPLFPYTPQTGSDSFPEEKVEHELQYKYVVIPYNEHSHTMPFTQAGRAPLTYAHWEPGDNHVHHIYVGVGREVEVTDCWGSGTGSKLSPSPSTSSPSSPSPSPHSKSPELSPHTHPALQHES
eukprot:GCRY01003913.1.p1 GENE.GCRY01003913.1~~GCRY01003913.1.p1  ORF type:complete len:526 (+),score=88.05 GCRY01003913.1:228-1805(+)